MASSRLVWDLIVRDSAGHAFERCRICAAEAAERRKKNERAGEDGDDAR